MATISVPATGAVGRGKPRRHAAAALALLPTAIVVLVVYLGCMLWTVRLSFSSSQLLPKLDWIGLQQYYRLFANDRFAISVENIAIFGVLFVAGCPGAGLPAGGVHRPAGARRRRVPHRSSFIPYAMSFIVTGLIWQWFLNPTWACRSWCATSASRLHLRLARQPGAW